MWIFPGSVHIPRRRCASRRGRRPWERRGVGRLSGEETRIEGAGRLVSSSSYAQNLKTSNLEIPASILSVFTKPPNLRVETRWT